MLTREHLCMVVNHAGTGSRCPKTKAPRLVLLPHQPILLVFLYLGGWSRTPPCCLYHFLNLTSWPAAGLCLHVRNNVGFLKASNHFLDVTSLVSEWVVNSVYDKLMNFSCSHVWRSFSESSCVLIVTSGQISWWLTSFPRPGGLLSLGLVLVFSGLCLWEPRMCVHLPLTPPRPPSGDYSTRGHPSPPVHCAASLPPQDCAPDRAKRGTTSPAG